MVQLRKNETGDGDDRTRAVSLDQDEGDRRARRSRFFRAANEWKCRGLLRHRQGVLMTYDNHKLPASQIHQQSRCRTFPRKSTATPHPIRELRLRQNADALRSRRAQRPVLAIAGADADAIPIPDARARKGRLRDLEGGELTASMLSATAILRPSL